MRIASCGLLVIFLSVSAGAVFAASKKPLSPNEISQKTIHDRVKILREERFDQMPYLDKGFIRSVIQPIYVEDKSKFVLGGEKRLNDILDRAIRVHTPVRAARERVSLARRRVLVAVRALFPEAQFEVTNKNGELSDVSFNSMDYKFTLRQPAFRGGILWNTLLQEKAGLEAAEKEYEAVVQDLINDVSAAYFEYQRASHVMEDQRKALEKMRRFIEISNQKFQEQLISEIENLNVQSLYSQLEYDYETSKQELELAKLELQRFLDIELQDKLNVIPFYQIDNLLETERAEEGTAKAGGLKGSKNAFIYGPTDVPELPALVDLSYQHRPELQVEAAKLESARLEERIKWGELMPHADVVLEMGQLGEAFDTVSESPGLRDEFRLSLEVNWNLGGNKMNYTFENQLNAPTVTQFQSGLGSSTNRNTFTVGLLDGLNDIANAKEAEVAKLDQVIALEKAEKEAVHDVKQAYFDYQKARIQVKSSLQRVDYRRRLAQLNEHRLGKNEIQISEYLQAEIDLIREMIALHKAVSEDFTARAKLNHAVGVRDYLVIEEQYGSKPAGG